LDRTNFDVIDPNRAADLRGLHLTGDDGIVVGTLDMRFNELVRLLEQNGFTLLKEKGSIRYYTKAGVDRLVRIDYHGAKEVPTGTCHAILKAAGLKMEKPGD